MTQNHSRIICSYLDSIYPNPKCLLKYKNSFEFLIAVCLSAQTKDENVNKVTPLLFKKYGTPLKLSKANIYDVAKIIKPIGLSNTKSKNIINLSKKLVNEFNSIVPNDRKSLMSLDGVGRKTSNLVLSECFGDDTFPVDTHINRISKRLKIAKNDDDVLMVEEKLKKYFPKGKWNKLHHQLFFFGRDICKSKNPNCEICKLKTICGRVF